MAKPIPPDEVIKKLQEAAEVSTRALLNHIKKLTPDEVNESLEGMDTEGLVFLIKQGELYEEYEACEILNKYREEHDL